LNLTQYNCCEFQVTYQMCTHDIAKSVKLLIS
jgi:hypothetical protein